MLFQQAIMITTLLLIPFFLFSGMVQMAVPAQGSIQLGTPTTHASGVPSSLAGNMKYATNGHAK